jgi:hypothetical protein
VKEEKTIQNATPIVQIEENQEETKSESQA